jgi:hypothetical protein
MNEPTLPYNGHSGAVTASDTSLERALAEDANGTTAARCNLILEHLKMRTHGLTWAELGAMLNLHHGQVSGALSIMHKNGQIFALRAKRNRSHPYVHACYRDLYEPTHRFDEPVKTKARQEREALQELLEAVDALLDQTTWDTIRRLRVARATVSDIDLQ